MDKSFASMGDVLKGYLSDELGQSLTDNQRAALIWHEANGTIEHAHTVGVYLKQGSAGRAPYLIVYLDNPYKAIDFGANKELYLERLRNQGLVLSDIRFKESKYKREEAPAAPEQAGEDVPPVAEADLPELSPEEERRARELTDGLEGELARAAYEAVSASFKRGKIS